MSALPVKFVLKLPCIYLRIHAITNEYKLQFTLNFALMCGNDCWEIKKIRCTLQFCTNTYTLTCAHTHA